MKRLREYIRLMKLFALGALLPCCAMLLLVVAGVAALDRSSRGLGGLLAGLGLLLLMYGCWGLLLLLRSWPPPLGRRVTGAEVPELQAWLEGCLRAWRGPAVEAVHLDAYGWGLDLVGTPVLGVLGWSRFHWVLGIFPLLVLGPREMEAVASWEAVWWSDQQGWLNLQVKRLVNVWQQLHLYLGKDRPAWRRRAGLGLGRWYARWMVRILEDFLVRECLWTDSVVAEQHGAATYGRALCRLAILRPLLDRRIFPDLQAQVQGGAPFPEDLYEHLEKALGRRPESAEGMLDLALEGLVPEAPPLLKLRLLHLAVTPAVPLPAGTLAIHRLLEGAPVLEELRAILETRLKDRLELIRQNSLRGDQRFRTLLPLMTGWYPNHPHAAEFINLAMDRVDLGEFGTLLVAFRRAHPRNVDGMLLSVQYILRKGRPERAQEMVRDLLGQNPFLAPACHAMLAAYFRDHGDLEQSEREWNRARSAEALQDQARIERGSASLGDSLEPHGCAGAQLEPMVSYLQALDGLGEAFLVRKKVAVHPELPVLLLVVRSRCGWWDPRGRKREAFKARIQRECPFPGRATGHVLVVRPGLLRRYRGTLEGLGARIQG